MFDGIVVVDLVEVCYFDNCNVGLFVYFLFGGGVLIGKYINFENIIG